MNKINILVLKDPSLPHNSAFHPTTGICSGSFEVIRDSLYPSPDLHIVKGHRIYFTTGTF